MLDLFAGTGAYGLEAWSRGAEQVDWVEADRLAQKALEVNMKRVSKALGGESSGGRVRMHRREVLAFLRDANPGNWDLVVADPPYADAREALPRVMEYLSAGGFPAEGLFVAEAPAEWDGDAAGWECRKVFGGGKGVGKPCVRLFARLVSNRL